MPPFLLYSFRRCPYAIRARLALVSAGLVPGVDLELREVSLKAKPPELLLASAKGTVPVLVARPGAKGAPCLLDESLPIMHWALERGDLQGWWAGWSAADRAVMAELIAENDGVFKHHLDRFKYPDRFPVPDCSVPDRSVADCSVADRSAPGLQAAGRRQHRQAALAMLRRWSERLAAGGWLLGHRPSLADAALLPFVRQFRQADPAGFDAESDLQPLQRWLACFLDSAELAAVMAPPWVERSPWRSPGWLYHLALRREWQAARGDGVYSRSTRGRSLEEVGFLHLSAAHQVEATAARFYADLAAGELVLLTLDPRCLADRALEVRWEAAPGSGELFPHLFGPLPLAAVLMAEPWRQHGSPSAA